MILGREPVAIAGLIGLAINLLVTFGLHLTVEQIGSINAFAGAVLIVLARSQTTPTANPVIPQGTSVTVTTPAGEPNK